MCLKRAFPFFADAKIRNFLCFISLLLATSFVYGSSCAEALRHILIERPSLEQKVFYRKVFEDTMDGLENMRSDSGMLADKLRIVSSGNYEVLNSLTSPTNIAFDLLSQMESIELKYQSQRSSSNIEKLLKSLAHMKRHPESGLFFSWYDTAFEMEVAHRGVSSVDNIHLALALWVASQKAPKQIGRDTAKRLLSEMNFSIFADMSVGKLHGFLAFEEATGKWGLEPWHYSYFGSEARTGIVLASALHLFRDIDSIDFAEAALHKKHMSAEFLHWASPEGPKHILRTWDGGTFQLVLPNILVGERAYSLKMSASLNNYSDLTLHRAQELKLSFPVAYSASNFGVDGSDEIPNVKWYVGQSGHPELVATNNQDFIEEAASRENWNRVVTSHAAFLAASSAPSRMAPALKSMRELLGTSGQPLYIEGAGFLDGIHTSGEHLGRVVPVQLALNQGMTALAIVQILASDRLSLSARLLRENAETSLALKTMYQWIDQRVLTID